MSREIPVEEIAGCTCLRLRKAARSATQIYDRHLEPVGLTITQFGLLAHLEARNGLSIGELAEVLLMDPTTLTRSLRPLERQGYARVVLDTQDRRRRCIELTERGKAVFREAAPLWRDAQARVTAALGPQGAARLNDELDRSLDRLAGA